MPADIIPLPEPCIVPVIPYCVVTGDSIILEGSSGRLWVVAFGKDGPPDVRPTSIILSDFLPSNYREDYVFHQCAGDRILVTYEAGVYVFSLSAGRALLSLRWPKSGPASQCLSPDGTLLLAFHDLPASFTSIYSVPDAAARGDQTGQPEEDFRTTIFNYQDDEPLLDKPGSALAVAIPDQLGLCHLLIGCFGYAVDWKLALGSRPDSIRVQGQPRKIRDFVYDPITVAQTFKYPYVFFSDLFGSGLSAFNLETGIRADCSWTPKKGGYGTFDGLLPGLGESFLVDTHNGWIRWSLDGRTERISTVDFVLLGETESGVWALPKDDPTRIVKVPLPAIS